MREFLAFLSASYTSSLGGSIIAITPINVNSFSSFVSAITLCALVSPFAKYANGEFVLCHFLYRYIKRYRVFLSTFFTCGFFFSNKGILSVKSFWLFFSTKWASAKNIVNGYNKTFAEIQKKKKNAISHRANALNLMKEEKQECLIY